MDRNLSHRDAGPGVISGCRSNPTPDVQTQSPLGRRTANRGTSGPHLPKAPHCNVYRDPNLGMLAALQVPSSPRWETRGHARSSRQRARTSESSPPRARHAWLPPGAWGPRSPRDAARFLSMVWTPAESSQSLPGQWRFRLWLWRDCFEAEVRGESMSQERAVPASAVPLEELSSWSEELCRRELPSVLPRLLISFTDCHLLLARGGVAGLSLFFLGLATPTAGPCRCPAARTLPFVYW